MDRLRLYGNYRLFGIRYKVCMEGINITPDRIIAAGIIRKNTEEIIRIFLKPCNWQVVMPYQSSTADNAAEAPGTPLLSVVLPLNVTKVGRIIS